ncbi:hypothetical protein, partial [Plasmodium yoelii yoelii]
MLFYVVGQGCVCGTHIR